MTARLFPTLDLRPGETPPSYVSRLARFHGVHSARGLCLEFDLRFQDLVDGDRDALDRLAVVAGVPVDELRADALTRDGDGYRLRGQALVKSSVRRTRLQGCPVCLAEDLAAFPSLPPGAAMAGRARWLLEPVRTCPEHRVALVGLAQPPSAHHLHDFALLVGPKADLVRQLAASAEARSVSGLERYLLGRLDGAWTPSPWLDALPWHAAAKTCEMLGAVKAFGRRPNLNKLTDEHWHRAGDAGFPVADEGEAGIRDFLSDLQRTYPDSSLGKEGPAATFGRLFDWLAQRKLHPAYQPVRDLVFRHVHETTPVGPEDELYGRRFPSRLIHSVRTAALESGLHPKRLRKVLAAAGHLPDGHENRLDHHVLFKVAEVERTLEIAGRAVSMVGAATYLNAGRVGTKLLADAGYIEPYLPADDSPAGLGKHSFAQADLDGFLSRLTDGAVPVEHPVPPRFDIPRAAKYAQCGAMDIVALVMAGRLDWVGTLVGARGYLSVLVDGDEIRRRVALPPVAGTTPGRVIKELRTTYHVVEALIAVGALPVQVMVNPLSRSKGRIILDQDLDAFRRTYVSVAELARERVRHPLGLKLELDRAGIEPAFDPKVVKASFYKRSEVG